MKTMRASFSGKTQVLSSLVLLLSLFSWSAAYAQITPSGDSYTNTADPTTNYGAKTLLDVDGATQITYIQFNLASIPAGATVSQATLKLYVNAVTTAGSFNVDYVNGAWTESTIDASNAPALGTTIASDVAITTADKNQYILIDITPAVQAWLSGSTANDGIALVANSTFNASFDSKENTTTSHPAELDIVFGTITGVTTASGSGLTGGGTSGTLNLGLLSTCASGQVLEWNGSAWACATAQGTGTVTSVGSGLGLTGGPITGSGTLSINTSVVPQLAAANTFTGNQTVNGTVTATSFSGNGAALTNVTAANSGELGGLAPSAFAQLATANTFTTNQTVNGTVSATGSVSAGGSVNAGTSFNLGGNLLAFGSYASGNAFLGFAGNTSTTGTANTAVGPDALYAITTGAANTASGALALGATSGSGNTAVGYSSGEAGDGTFVTGSYNTFIGYESGLTTGALNNATVIGANSYVVANNATVIGANSYVNGSNATAIGANAEVAENNALVLGSINGVNGATASTNVGIGTTTPNAALDVVASNVQTLIGNGGCGSSYAGIGFVVEGGFNSGCTNYALLGENNGNLYINSVESGTIFFRNNNGANLMTIDTSGDVTILGKLSKGSGSFKIDHPLDPANKYLYHSFVESPDMMNVYNGNITTNQRGVAVIVLPEYFEALNRDFRYQLTVIGQFAQAIVARKIAHNRFVIRTNKPSVEVSWQVTGIRHDAYADAHRIQVEVEKPPQEQGHYLHPELFGALPEDAVGAQAAPVTKSGSHVGH